ncbi:hypothetical protein ACFVUS_40405 [Nocardia sp. NPDC058058]|uniref:hypothetical protein n=1 Tax=Nocardia sp. NPDC058058 TaxID=3346317 RepID=UPI0036DD601E
MSSPNLPPEILAALHTPIAESSGAGAGADSNADDAPGFTDAVSYERWYRDLMWSVREPPWM